MFITKKHLSRRTFLHGAGVTLALPLLESMVPAGTALAQHGGGAEDAASAASTFRTARRWTSGRRRREGTEFEFSEILQPLEPFRDRVNVVSDLAHAPVAPWSGEDTGGAENHVRAAAVFLSGAHPARRTKRTSASPSTRWPRSTSARTRRCRRSSCRSRAAEPELRRRGLHLRLPQHALVEDRRRCRCRWRTIRRSCSSGCSATAAPTRSAQARRQQARSLLDSVRGRCRRSRRSCRRATAPRCDDYLDDVREIERRVQKVDAQLSRESRRCPTRRSAFRRTFEDHFKLMFDLQVLA